MRAADFFLYFYNVFNYNRAILSTNIWVPMAPGVNCEPMPDLSIFENIRPFMTHYYENQLAR